MRRTLALAVAAVSAVTFLGPLSSANAACTSIEVKPIGCLPSECLLVARVVSTANEALGGPLQDGFPHCID